MPGLRWEAPYRYLFVRRGATDSNSVAGNGGELILHHGIVNGGPPGLIFGLLVAIFYYSFIGLSLAEVKSFIVVVVVIFLEQGRTIDPWAYTGIVCILGTIRRRGISLGNHHSRSEMGPFGRLLHRLD